MTVPSALQSAPPTRGPGTAQIRWMVPVARLSLRSSPSAKKPTNWPSGDQKGSDARRCRPASGRSPPRGVGSRASRTRPRWWRPRGPPGTRSGCRRVTGRASPSRGRPSRRARRRRTARREAAVAASLPGGRRRARPPPLPGRARPRTRPSAPSVFPALRIGGRPGVAAARLRGAPAGQHVLQLEPGGADVREPRARVLAQAAREQSSHGRRASPPAARRGRAPSSPPTRSRRSRCRRRRACAPSASPTAGRRRTTRPPACRRACPAPARATCRRRCPGSARPPCPCAPGSGTGRGPLTRSSRRARRRPRPWRGRSRGP